MWGQDAKVGTAKAAARVLSELVLGDRLARGFRTLSHLRTLFDEGTSALWHFAAMPSRHDVRFLQRRVSSLRRHLRDLDQALAQLEQARGGRVVQ
jgi:hypothetical protein